MPEPQSTSCLRLFIAISLPEDVKARILDAQSDLQAAASGGSVRWARPEQFHLTLRFLGSIDAVHVPALKASLLPVCRSFPPFRLRAAGIGFFPGPRAPRVVWVGVSESGDRLVPLHEAVQNATAGFTSEKPETRFTGHVTLGRVKKMRRSETEALASAAARFSSQGFGDWIAPEVHLIRSELSPQGARHALLEAFAFESAC